MSDRDDPLENDRGDMVETEDVPDDWTRLDTETEYDNGWYEGGFDEFERPDGSSKRYYWAALPPAVVIVAVDGDDVLFVEQFRPTIRQTHLELPAGIVEDGETYAEAGRRELREETGYDAGELVVMQEVWAATGVLCHRRGYVFATDLSFVGRDLDDGEFLTLERIPVEEAIDRAREVPANDATIEGLLLAQVDGLLSTE